MGSETGTSSARTGAESGLSRAVSLLSRTDVRRPRLLLFALVLACAFVAAFTGFGQTAEEQYRLLWDQARTRPATGSVHIVEIDARSLSDIGVWPWPRGHHARLVDALGARGVQTLAFDVDFSAHSPDPTQDLAFAAALGRFPGTVILPTFRQAAGGGQAGSVESLPIPSLRASAFLASVNVHPDADGQLRQYSFGTMTGGQPRPTIGAMLSGVSGRVEEQFRIDTAIDHATIPRHSYADLLSGRDRTDLKGKAVIVGATAIELGDRYAMVGQGVVPGVVIQALAAETLLQGTANPDRGPWPLLLVALVFGLTLMRTEKPGFAFATTLIGVIAILATPLAFASMAIGTLRPGAGLLFLSLLSFGLMALDVLRRSGERRLSDPETGLPNARSLGLAEKRSGRSGTVVAVRFRDFERIASVLNQQDRDELVRRIVPRLALAAGNDTIHALQGGVFGWSTQQGSAERLSELANSIAATFRSPLQVGSRAVLVTPAMGAARASATGMKDAINQAIAMAGEAERQELRWLVHDSSHASSADRSVSLLGGIEEAISSGAIIILYQPQVRMTDLCIVSAEALIRWQHPDYGLIMPDHFIPLLEKHKRMADLTLHVLERVQQTMVTDAQAGRTIGYAINISASLFDDADFVAALVETLRCHQRLPGLLTLEITESATLSSTSEAVTALEALRSMGVRIAIDDYGTGQSTLRYLKAFPTDEIKIDKSFITHLLETPGDQILVRSTIDMAHDLGFQVVAEGIETAECRALLQNYGCDYGQGWLIGKPMDHNALLELIAGSASHITQAA